MRSVRNISCIMTICLLVSVFKTSAQQNASGSPPPAPRAKLLSAEKVFIAKSKQAYLVTFTYAFDGLPDIYVNGLGVVPSQGSYQYLSTQQEIQFCDPVSRAVLERLPIRETTVVAAKAPLNQIPDESKFSKPFHSYTWNGPASLQERVNEVFAKYFQYYPHEMNKINYLATTYTTLPLSKKLSDSGVLAQLALLVSFPYDPEKKSYSYHIQYSVMEGRALSDDFRPTNNPEITGIADRFVDSLVAELQAGK